MCGFGFNSFGGFRYGNFGGFGIGMGIMMLVWLIVFGFIIFSVVKSFRWNGLRNSTPMRILDEKYAKGEITEEEYMKRKNILSGR